MDPNGLISYRPPVRPASSTPISAGASAAPLPLSVLPTRPPANTAPGAAGKAEITGSRAQEGQPVNAHTIHLHAAAARQGAPHVRVFAQLGLASAQDDPGSTAAWHGMVWRVGARAGARG
jgi:hypothetical protein